jgi:beta-lactamase class A
MRWASRLAGALLAVLLAGPALAAGPREGEALARLFTQGRLESEWFTRPFLREVPTPRLAQILGGLQARFGAFGRVVQDRSGLTVVMERGYVPASISLDPDGRIATLLFKPAFPRLTGLDRAVDLLRARDGRVSLLVEVDGRETLSFDPHLALGVGSSFKLLVLRSLLREVEEGRRRWSDILTLEERHRGANGILKDWPAGTPLSLGSLAILMIAQSDNTATDMLMEALGPEALERDAPTRLKPLLSTRRMLALHFARDPALVQRWLEASEAERRTLLPRIDGLPLAAPDQGLAEIDWHMTTRELCRLMRELAGAPQLSVNKGPAAAIDHDRAFYKGGYTLTSTNQTLLVERGGRSVCVSATWTSARGVPAGGLDAVITAILHRLLIETPLGLSRAR